MDWYLEADDRQAATALRREFTEYLRRHATPDSDVWSAELVFEELLANALQHAAGPVWVSVNWSALSPVLTVHDLGDGFRPDTDLPADLLSEEGRGLHLVANLADELSVAVKRAGGSKVTTKLPVRRTPETTYASPRPRSGALPASDEAGPEGTFAREPFLRALVVELARTLEHEHGPAAAEAAVAQVGAEVGARIEDAHRAAKVLTGRLDSQQMADLFVQLKRAIDGDFYVIEADDEKIVLGNRACPFGDVVQRAPSLCRMTSSVFGGIAARNAEAAAVVLEERIAVGDPECRVVVWLRPPPQDAEPIAHRYGRVE